MFLVGYHRAFMPYAFIIVYLVLFIFCWLFRFRGSNGIILDRHLLGLILSSGSAYLWGCTLAYNVYAQMQYCSYICLVHFKNSSEFLLVCTCYVVRLRASNMMFCLRAFGHLCVYESRDIAYRCFTNGAQSNEAFFIMGRRTGYCIS